MGSRMSNIQIFLAAAVFMLAAGWLNDNERIPAEPGWKARLRRWVSPGRGGWLMFALGVAGGTALCVVLGRYGLETARHQLKALFLYSWLVTAACCDIRTRRIPNGWILYGAAAWAAFWLLEGDREQSWTAGLLFSLRGALAGAGMLLLGAMFRENGIGMGDVKLYLILGLFLGCQTVLQLMLTALAGALCCGLIGMASGKLKRSDRIPVGPFTYLGFIVVAVFLRGVP